MTIEQAKCLVRGQILHYEFGKNADGTCMRFKVNGKVKLWKSAPHLVKVPLKRGLKEYGYISTFGLGASPECFHLDKDCKDK